jgi:hypothetical protein
VGQDVIPSLSPGNIRAVFDSILTSTDKPEAGAGLIGKVVEQMAEKLILGERSSPKSDEVMKRIKLESVKLSTRILVNMRLSVGEEPLVNPGVCYHVILTDGLPDVILFNENVRMSHILEVFGGLKDHMIGTYRATLAKSMKAKYPPCV